jgi:hypothetical protein
MLNRRGTYTFVWCILFVFVLGLLAMGFMAHALSMMVNSHLILNPLSLPPTG